MLQGLVVADEGSRVTDGLGKEWAFRDAVVKPPVINAAKNAKNESHGLPERRGGREVTHEFRARAGVRGAGTSLHLHRGHARHHAAHRRLI